MIPSSREVQYSSSVAKLMRHANRIKHPMYPITLQVVPTDKCNLNCVFCSVKDRPRNELDFDKIISVVESYPFRILRGVEITGGGDPTLYPRINELIERLVEEYWLDVGFITNGVALHKNISESSLALLTWIRISLNCLDYLPDIDIPEIPEGTTLGFSYVVNEKTTKEILDKVAKYSEIYPAKYVRIVPDCLDLSRKYDFDIPDSPKFYVQTKAFGDLTPVAPCRMGYLKPYLNSDGYFYWCSGVCLGTRYFPTEYRMGAWDESDMIWADQKPFECHFDKCFWVEQNLLLGAVNTKIEHEAFI